MMKRLTRLATKSIAAMVASALTLTAPGLQLYAAAADVISISAPGGGAAGGGARGQGGTNGGAPGGGAAVAVPVVNGGMTGVALPGAVNGVYRPGSYGATFGKAGNLQNQAQGNLSSVGSESESGAVKLGGAGSDAEAAAQQQGF